MRVLISLSNGPWNVAQFLGSNIMFPLTYTPWNAREIIENFFAFKQFHLGAKASRGSTAITQVSFLHCLLIYPNWLIHTSRAVCIHPVRKCDSNTLITFIIGGDERFPSKFTFLLVFLFCEKNHASKVFARGENHGGGKFMSLVLSWTIEKWKFKEFALKEMLPPPPRIFSLGNSSHTIEI